jgi:hypothetical protein
MPTPLDFAKALLHFGGFPTSTNNLKAIVAWEAGEGGHYHNGAEFNPLNTTMPMPGASAFSSSVPIGIYTSWKQGLDATLKTLKLSAYQSVRDSLKRSAPPGETLAAIDSTPWGTHDFGSDYASYAEQAWTNYANASDPVGGSLPKYLAISGGVLVAGLCAAAAGAYLFRKNIPYLAKLKF